MCNVGFIYAILYSAKYNLAIVTYNKIWDLPLAYHIKDVMMYIPLLTLRYPTRILKFIHRHHFNRLLTSPP